MSTSAPTLVSPTPAPVEPGWKEFARSPLVPVALAVSAGLIIDRYTETTLAGELLVSGLAMLAWLVARIRKSDSAAIWLWLAAGALAAAHHHTHRHAFAPDDIGTFTGPRLAVVRVRGTLDEEPARFRPAKPDPLMTVQKVETTVTVLAVTSIETPDGWTPTR